MRVFSPVVLGVAVTIAALAVAILFLQPELWMRAILAIAFLPVAAIVMRSMTNRHGDPDVRRRATIRIRAAMVGGGALLISALGFTVADSLGLVSDGAGKSIVSLVLVLVVVFGDLLAARMERAAERPPDAD